MLFQFLSSALHIAFPAIMVIPYALDRFQVYKVFKFKLVSFISRLAQVLNCLFINLFTLIIGNLFYIINDLYVTQNPLFV